MSKVPNPHKFLVKTVTDFIDKSIAVNKPDDEDKPPFRPSEFYTQGHCAEYAFNLAKHAKSKGIDTDVTIMFGDFFDVNSGEFKESRLSHVVLDFDGKSYDVTAWDGDARRTWFIKAGYIDTESTGVERKWRFESVSTEDMDEVYEFLKTNCDRHNVSFDDKQLEKDFSIFQSLIRKSTLDNGLNMP